MRRGVLRASIGICAAAVVGLAFFAGAAYASSRPVVVEQSLASSSGPVAVAIGDSIMEGHGLPASEAWPVLLGREEGWQITNLASPGSGFLKHGSRGDDFLDQAKAAVRLDPSIVIVSGSSNDVGENNAALAQATTNTIEYLHAKLPNAKIIAVSAVWGATTPPAQLTQIDQQVKSAVAAVGGSYLDIGQPMQNHPELMQPSDVHPTAQGQQILASSIDEALVRDGVSL